MQNDLAVAHPPFGAGVAIARVNPVLFQGVALRLAAPADNLPAANTQTGNVFHDRSAANVAWYLPQFALAGAPDAAFAFAASQAGVDVAGNPFNRAIVTLGLRTQIPPDAATFAAQNPTIQMRQIPLDGLTATLTTTAADATTGTAQSSSYTGTLTAGPGGAFTFSVASLIGAAVIVAFENLKNGGASIALAGTYTVWHPQGVIRPVPWPPVRRFPNPGPGPGPHPISPIHRMPMMELAQPNLVVHPIDQPLAPQPVQTGSEGTAPFGCVVPIASAYAGSAYAAAFSVTQAGATHTIVSAADLTSFQTQQSEYSEFTALGNVSQTYPSFSALYIGALSRTIVAVPARYGIVRGSSGTAAVCQALLDSAAGSSGACTFQFAFVLAPLVSPIDLLQLTADLAKNPASHDCTVALPTQINRQIPATLATPFQTSVSCLAGAQPQTFALTVTIADGGSAASPAVANANLFIEQLTAAVEPFLVGQFGIKLDDAYATPITVGAVVNFSMTGGSDDVAYTIDPSSGALALSNASPLDLSVTRYAVVTGGQEVVHPLAQSLLAGQSATVAPSGVDPSATILVDRTLALESPFTKANTARYLDFELQDVQAVQYELGILAGSVSFAARGIAGIAVGITLNDLPQLAVPGMTLTALDQSANEQIALPIQYALSTLAAMIQCTVTFVNPQQAATRFTLTNDFIASPVFVLTDAAIPASAF